MPERVISRDEKEFGAALDGAASIGTTGRPHVFGQVLLWGLIEVPGLLCLGDRVIDWPIRRAIPGVDLVKHSLRGTPADEYGLGRRPQCGQAFSTGQYVMPVEAGTRATSEPSAPPAPGSGPSSPPDPPAC